MFDTALMAKRYFPVKLAGLTLEVEPPKLKVLKRVMEGDSQDLGAILTSLALLLSKNREGKTITVEFLEETLDFDTAVSLLAAFFRWLSEVGQDPN